MRKVIRINQEETKEKPVEFTHVFHTAKGWGKCVLSPSAYESVVYLGNCVIDGDMFSALTDDGLINIYKGHLNSGEY